MSGFALISSASTPAPDIADALRVRGKLTQSSPSGFTTQERILSDHFMLFTEQIGTSRFGYYCGADGIVPENPEHDRWSATKTRSSVGRGNRRPGQNDRMGVSEWWKIWTNGLANEGRSPKSGHRMAAEGMQFSLPWNYGTISTNLDVIWGISVETCGVQAVQFPRLLHLVSKQR
jgi:hypothetical protein